MRSHPALEAGGEDGSDRGGESRQQQDQSGMVRGNFKAFKQTAHEKVSFFFFY
jgi:hypothetical protein